MSLEGSLPPNPSRGAYYETPDSNLEDLINIIDRSSSAYEGESFVSQEEAEEYLEQNGGAYCPENSDHARYEDFYYTPPENEFQIDAPTVVDPHSPDTCPGDVPADMGLEMYDIAQNIQTEMIGGSFQNYYYEDTEYSSNYPVEVYI